MSLTGERPAWHADAVCRGATPAFFPERGGEVASARAMCAVCPVKVECLDFALASGEMFGIWGGKSERERRTMRRVRKFGRSEPLRVGQTHACNVDGCTFVASGPAAMGSHMAAHRRAAQFAANRSTGAA